MKQNKRANTLVHLSHPLSLHTFTERLQLLIEISEGLSLDYGYLLASSLDLAWTNWAGDCVCVCVCVCFAS